MKVVYPPSAGGAGPPGPEGPEGPAGPAGTNGTNGTNGTPTLIAEQIVAGSVAASITFSSIPQTYRHLKLRVVARGDTAAASIIMNAQFNGDTAANYDCGNVGATNTGVSATAAVAQTAIIAGYLSAASAPSNVPGVVEAWIYDYARTVFEKVYHALGVQKLSTAVGGISERYWSGWWRSTAAITQIVLTPSAGNFVIGSVFSLYGST